VSEATNDVAREIRLAGHVVYDERLPESNEPTSRDPLDGYEQLSTPRGQSVADL
jgi:hypothetical protein